MEKSLRVLGGGEGHAHSHDHSDAVPEESTSSAVKPNSVGESLRSRRKVNEEQQPDDQKHRQSEEGKGHISGPSKLSAYLNLFGDFVHNMYVCSWMSFLGSLLTCILRSTDGLA